MATDSAVTSFGILFYQTKYFQSRKKQQTELVRSVLYAEADKKRKERENLQGPAFFLRRFFLLNEVKLRALITRVVLKKITQISLLSKWYGMYRLVDRTP